MIVWEFLEFIVFWLFLKFIAAFFSRMVIPNITSFKLHAFYHYPILTWTNKHFLPFFVERIYFPLNCREIRHNPNDATLNHGTVSNFASIFAQSNLNSLIDDYSLSFFILYIHFVFVPVIDMCVECDTVPPPIPPPVKGAYYYNIDQPDLGE